MLTYPPTGWMLSNALAKSPGHAPAICARCLDGWGARLEEDLDLTPVPDGDRVDWATYTGLGDHLRRHLDE
jgi:hypothetical protein